MPQAFNPIDERIFNQLFADKPDLDELKAALQEKSKLNQILATVKMSDALVPLVLDVALGLYPIRAKGYAAGVQPEAFALFVKNIGPHIFLIHANLRAIASRHAPAAAQYFSEFFGEPTAAETDAIKSTDEIRAEYLRLQLGSLPKVRPDDTWEDTNESAIGGILNYFREKVTKPPRELLDDIVLRLRYSKENLNIYDGLIELLEAAQFGRNPNARDQFIYYKLIQFPKERACILRNLTIGGTPVLVYAAQKGFQEIKKNNLDLFLKELSSYLTVENNPNDPLMAACEAGNIEMFQYFFERYLGYRDLAAVHLENDVWGKKFIINAYLEKAIDYLINTPNAVNRQQMLAYLGTLKESWILTGSNRGISIPEYLKNNENVPSNRISLAK